ncbi:MAG: ATPase, partial [Pararhizobium sp.]
IPDSSTSTTRFLSAMGMGEAIAFGVAIAVPMRMRFARVPQNRLPRANSDLADQNRGEPDLRLVVQRMRAIVGNEIGGAGGGYQPGDDPYAPSRRPDDEPADAYAPRAPQQPTADASPAARPSLLRRRDDFPHAERTAAAAPERAATGLAGDREIPRRESALSGDAQSIRSMLLRKPLGERK